MKLRPEIHIPPGLRPLLRDMKTIFPNDKNARTHKKGQIKALALNAEKLGYNSAIAVDREGRILAGHARYAAALLLGMTHVPVIVLDTLTEAQKRAFMLGDNQLATLSGWDRGILAEDFAYLNGELPSLGITFADLGFAVGEVNAVSEDRAIDPRYGIVARIALTECSGRDVSLSLGLILEWLAEAGDVGMTGCPISGMVKVG